MKVFIVISLKPGSTRCPRKNFRYIAPGLPIYDLAIQKGLTLKNAGIADVVRVISSEERVAEILPKEVEFRLNSRDNENQVGELASLRTAVPELQSEDILLKISVCNPFLRVELLEKCVRTVRNGAEMCECAVPIQRLLVDENGNGISWNGDRRPRTQDLKPLFDSTGSVAFSGAKLLSGRTFDGRTQTVNVSALEGFDIDTEEDFVMAQALWRDAK